MTAKEFNEKYKDCLEEGMGMIEFFNKHKTI